MTRTRPLRLSVFLVVLLTTVVGHANALDYPKQTIKVVVPFAAAGVTDIVARVVFDRIARTTGQTIVIDNRPGAGGTIAVEQVVNAPPDGYTLVMADPSGSLPANVTLYPNLKYHPIRDLAPVAIFGNTGAVLLVNNDLPVKSAQELVALGKSKPGELTFASTGVGTPGHLNGELFSRLAGIKAVHVPYRVVGQAVTDFVAGRIAFWIAPIPTMLQNVRQGQLKPLAVAGEPAIGRPSRHSDRSRKPASAISTHPRPMRCLRRRARPAKSSTGFTIEIGRALEDEAVQQKLRAAGVTPKIGAPEEVTKMLEWRIPEWADVIKSAGIKIN